MQMDIDPEKTSFIYETKIYVDGMVITHFFNNTIEGVMKYVLFELTEVLRIHEDSELNITANDIEEYVSAVYGQWDPPELNYLINERAIQVKTQMREVGE